MKKRHIIEGLGNRQQKVAGPGGICSSEMKNAKLKGNNLWLVA